MEYKSIVIFEATGVQTVFTFSFDYLRPSFIKVSLNGVEGLVYGIDYVISGTSIEFTVAPTGTLKIYRKTPTDRLVSWSEGSVLKASDMTVQQVQTQHVLDETVDRIFNDTMSKNLSGHWDAQNKRITNVQSPVDDGDVVTKSFLKAYASLGGEDSGLDPEAIAQMLSDVVAHGESITAIELAMTTLQGDIPTLTSQLTNDSNFVVDTAYVHTDNNFDATYKQRIDTLKEVQRVEFSDTSAEWAGSANPFTYTYPLVDANTLLGLFRLTDGKYVQDTTTTAYVSGTNVIISAPAKFNGYFIVTGTVAYGDLEDTLALILNEDVGHTWTLEEIIGETYREAAMPTQEQLDASISAFTSLMNTSVSAMNTQSADITSLTSRLTIAEADIVSLKSRVTALEAV